jgi:hypothetical protein
MRRFQSLSAALIALSIFTSHANSAELLTNGNFELFTSGQPNSWPYGMASGGPTNLQDGTNSPFTSVYPAGSNSVMIWDLATEPNYTHSTLRQSFTNQTTTTYVSWDFQLGALTGNRWSVQVDDSISALTRFDMDAPGGKFAFQQNFASVEVMSLVANLWYHVEVALDPTTHTLAGTIRPQNGLDTPFSGGFGFAAGNSVNKVILYDETPGVNATIRYDNFSVSTTPYQVPEPSTVILLASAAGVLLAARRRLCR